MTDPTSEDLNIEHSAHKCYKVLAKQIEHQLKDRIILSYLRYSIFILGLTEAEYYNLILDRYVLDSNLQIVNNRL